MDDSDYAPPCRQLWVRRAGRETAPLATNETTSPQERIENTDEVYRVKTV